MPLWWIKHLPVSSLHAGAPFYSFLPCSSNTLSPPLGFTVRYKLKQAIDRQIALHTFQLTR